MGIIVNDYIILPIGTSKIQCYLNIGNEAIILNKHPTLPGFYNVSVSFCIYFDQDSYLRKGVYMDKQRITITLRSSELSQNLYEVLYDNLKKKYNSFINI
jgi:hypothetical protein